MGFIPNVNGLTEDKTMRDLTKAVGVAPASVTRGRMCATVALALTGVLLLIACDEIIQVEAPSRVLARELDNPANAALLVASTGADFECALGHYIVAGGLVGNELEIATTLIAMKEYDKRDFKSFGSVYSDVTCASTFSVGVYKPLSTARWQGDNTLDLLQGWSDADVPNRQDLIARAAAYAGYGHILLGEAMCTVALDVGSELQPANVFERAEERFATAISAAQSAGNNDVLNWARVGLGRALARQGKLQEAASAVQAVPEGFAFDATFSTESPRRENAVWDRNSRDQGITVDPSYRNLTFGGVADPRVDLTDTGGTASDAETPLWLQTKYPSLSAPVPIATWEEAQLIIAEARLASGDGAGAVEIINTLHANVGLPDFNSSDLLEIENQLIEERQREFFLESHHLGDVRQYGIPLSPAPGVPFKDGGGTYLDQSCFPLPDVERLNNPSIGG